MSVVLHVLAPAAVGGMESVVKVLAEGLVASGTRVHAHVVAEPGPTPSYAEGLRETGAEVHVTAVPSRRYDVERAATLGLCERHGVEVVHCHGYRPDVIDAPAVRREGIPVVSTVHGFTGGGWKNALYEWLQLRSLARMDRVVAVSRPLVESLASRGVPRNRILLLPNAWAADASAPGAAEARRSLGLGPGPAHRVGWIGRMSPEKGADVFVDAALAADRSDVEWVMIGDGPDRAAVEAAAARGGMAERVRFAGMIPGAGRLVRAFDVVVLSSRTEGTPIVALEAMAAGVPVVATRVGGIPDLLDGGAGVLVAPERPRELADAVTDLLADPSRAKEMAARARARIDERYAVAPWVEAHRHLYDELAHGRT